MVRPSLVWLNFQSYVKGKIETWGGKSCVHKQNTHTVKREILSSLLEGLAGKQKSIVSFFFFFLKARQIMSLFAIYRQFDKCLQLLTSCQSRCSAGLCLYVLKQYAF